nr:MAG TPA: hypothetical protein [Crassvirales sp.]
MYLYSTSLLTYLKMCYSNHYLILHSLNIKHY